MVLVQKCSTHGVVFFLCIIGKENVFYDILERKNAVLRYKKKKFKKSKNWHFSKGVNPWFWSKNGHFSNLFFLDKNAFVGYRNRKFKNSKNWHFSKRVNPWFRSKNNHFSNLFVLGNIGQEKVVYDILKPINAFLGYEKKKFKKAKKLTFFEIMVLVQKWPFFQPVFFF